MEFLSTSKRAWLFSYLIGSAVSCGVFVFALNNEIGKTCFVLSIEMQIMMLITWLLIVILKWVKGCRCVLSILYLAGTIYLGVNQVIKKWYIILLIGIVVWLYMMWNIGGVVNCIIAGRYKKKIDKLLQATKENYIIYKEKLNQYNKRNDLKSWTQISLKKEPNWDLMRIKESGIDFFEVRMAILGISLFKLKWERDISKLNQINSRLRDKQNAIDSNLLLHKEMEVVTRIERNERKIGIEGNTKAIKEKLLSKIKESKKKIKKILRRKI